MNIQIKAVGLKEIQKIYIRVYANRLDLSVCTELSVLKSDWDAETESSKTDLQLNENLLKLKLEVLKQFNYNLTKGLIINTIWLKNVVKTTFDRPIQEVGLVNSDFNIYVSDFAYHWLDNFASNWKVSQKKFLTAVGKSQYRKFVDVLAEFEKSEKTKFNLKDLTIDDIYLLVNWLQEQEYNSSTIERYIGRLKFFLNRATEHKINVSNVRNQRIYIDKDEDIEHVILSETEINKIINTDFSFSQELSIAKQNYILLLFTGLRGEDGLQKLNINNFQDGFIKFKTSKTGQPVVIPVHKELDKVLNANFGNLPPKMNLTDFNIAIKKICQVCEFDELVEGKLFDKKKKRKVKGWYKKYSLISSHSCRRGFCTMYYGKLPNEVIASVLGWSNNAMVNHYNKTTKEDYANILKQHWENK